jgi:AcrR family transcriptional regulator
VPKLSKAAAQERRAKIVALAEKRFIQKGYEQTTVDQIVDEMGIAKGTYYYHFDSKEDLMIAVSDKLVQETSAKLMAVYNQKDKDIVWRIRNVLKTYVDDFYKNKDIWKHVFHWRNTTLYRRVASISAKRYTPIIEDLLDEALKEGKIAVPHPHEGAESVLVLIDLTYRQLCAKNDYARRVRIFETFRYLLAHILSDECIPQFEQEIRDAAAPASRK